MSVNKLDEVEVQHLLKNIVSVLKHYSVSEFNDILITAISKKSENANAEKYILELVCDKYKISYRALIYSKSKQHITEARQVAFCLLHYTLGLSTRYIANRIFHFKHHSTVGDAIRMYKRLDIKLKPDKDLKESIESLREKITEKLHKQ